MPPFSSSNLPTGDTNLPAGASLAIPLTYAPTTASTADNPELSFIVDGVAPLTVPLTGSAVVGSPALTLKAADPQLRAGPARAPGDQDLQDPQHRRRNVTLEKAAPPSGEFTTDNPVSEGSEILPDAGIVQTITFTPTKKGLSTARYLITGDDSNGHQAEELVGYDDLIADWYASHGGASSFLGKPTGAEHPVGTGYSRGYGGGRLYWLRRPASTRRTVRSCAATSLLAGLVDGPAPHVERPSSSARPSQPVLRRLADLLVTADRRVGGLREGGALGSARRAARPTGLSGGQHQRDPGGLRGDFRHGITWTTSTATSSATGHIVPSRRRGGGTSTTTGA